MSFIIPVVFMALPFALLKLQGVPISFEKYVEILMDMAKKHFVGQALFSCRESMSATNVIYLFAMLALYVFQIYTNIATCVGYHRNIRKINACLIEAREYAIYSVRSMTAFADLHGDKPGYREFCGEATLRCEPLQNYADRLKNITPFSNTPDKLADMGRLLALFYELHSCAPLRESIQYSFGFAGYIDNMLGVYNSLAARAVNFATFTQAGDLTMRAQYYAAHRDDAYVSNDCSLAAPMIISGPNASGKTTFLKATAINVVLTQQFGCGFYEECSISPYAHINTYLNIPDSSGRDSLFQAEARRCKAIVDAIRAAPAEHRHFCIFDELFSGTNPEEATSAGCALVSYLAGFPNVNFLLTTHYRSICDRFRKSKTVENWRMAAESNGGKMRYSYKIERGVSQTKGAAEVLRAMDFPEEILNDVDAFPIGTAATDELPQKEVLIE
jgi:MutS domain V